MSYITIDLKCDSCPKKFERMVRRDSLDEQQFCDCRDRTTATRIPSAPAGGVTGGASPFMRRKK